MKEQPQPLRIDLRKEAALSVIAHAFTYNSPEVKEIVKSLPAKVFFYASHRTIWKAVLESVRTCGTVDLILVTQILRLTNSQFTGYELSMISDKYKVGAPIQQHATFLVEDYMKEKLFKINQTTISEIDNGVLSVLELFQTQQAKQKLLFNECLTIIKKINGSYNTSILDVVDAELANIIRDVEAGTVSGIPYGIPGMDNKVDLMVPGDMIVIGARPGMGKTIMAMQIAIHAATVLNIPVDFHSLEMTKSKLAQRIISMFTAFTTNDILYRKVSKAQIEEIRSTLKTKLNNNLNLYDNANIDVDGINSDAEKSGAGLIILDYLQLSKGSKQGTRENDVSEISRGVKNTAMERKVPFIAISQLSRKVEERTSTQFRPVLSDLRESGSIEQDADTVILLYRPNYYGFKSKKYHEDITEINIAKQRNGKRPTVPALFDTKTNQFIHYDYTEENNNTDQEILDSEGF